MILARDSAQTEAGNQCKLYDLLDHADPQEVKQEVHSIATSISPNMDGDLLETVHNDIIRLFKGEYPGFRASTAKYHDLEHTNSVALATVRILHGLALSGKVAIDGRMTLTALVAALFHDLGLVQTLHETQGTGARFMVGHEKRSIAFLRAYFADKNVPPHFVDDAAHIIQVTELVRQIDTIHFRTETIRLLAKVVGSADLLAQMADRKYLEKLLLLFEEFEEAGLNAYTTEIELYHQTNDFYQKTVQPRLASFDNIAHAVQHHFRMRFGINADLYHEAIQCNIDYLQHVLRQCNESMQCYSSHFNRPGIANPTISQKTDPSDSH
ncbi:HD domain-containing protein [Desulfovibrio inopinatus]|uniref:HD domain-containing protein n=1 Tax=Desulfovibrio inopinatus TaxID=102109 RepID=UPI000408528B|nr:HD domain-containing protein [Desulfovibrio inopinatus]